MIIKAAYYEHLDSNKVKCTLCPANCTLTDGKVGICKSRFNREGKLLVDNFGELVSACYDPVEKKPLYHFFPGSPIFSTGANGCNLSCDNCQNWEISQMKVPTRFVSPPDLLKYASDQDSIGVAYTYTEPLIWFEYLLQAGRLVKKAGLKNVLVTNGYINAEPLRELLPVIDAANVDLKSLNPHFYKRVCKGKIEPIMANIKTLFEAGVHIEITNLVITGLNDSDEDFNHITDFVSALSRSIPMHFSAYYPTYKMTRPHTSVEKLLRAHEIASTKLDYVYLGNVHLPGKSDTFCPNCRAVVIGRHGYSIDISGMDGNKCSQCGHKIDIVWK